MTENGETTSTTKDSNQRSLYVPLRVFLDAMQATLDLEAFIADQREYLSVEAVFTRVASRLMPTGKREHHELVAKVVHGIVHERSAARDELVKKGATAGELTQNFAEHQSRMRERIIEITGRPEDYHYYGTVWRRTVARPDGAKVLRASLLIGAVSDFEVLISGIVRAQLAATPEILRTDEQKYSMRDLESFDTLDAFRAHCAERMAEGLLRGGLGDWMEWFAKRHKLSVPGVTDCPIELQEIFQRRHLLVHNGGVVNTSYLTNVKGLDATPAIGDRLRVSGDYLRRAIDILTVAGVKLAGSLSRKLFSEVDSLQDLDSQVSALTYDLLQDARYEAVEAIADWQLTFVTKDDKRIVAMVNRWIALKQKNGLASVKEEIERWDTSTLANLYKLVRLALLDQDEDAYVLAKSLLASSELGQGDWHTWPVFEGVRAYAATRDVGEDAWLYDTPHTDDLTITDDLVIELGDDVEAAPSGDAS